MAEPKTKPQQALADFFKAQKITVAVADTDDEGNPVVKDGRIATRQAALADEHIFASHDSGDEVSIVTTDGQRYRAAKAKASA